MMAVDVSVPPQGADWRPLVGRVIRERRLTYGLTQQEAADVAGVSVGAWRSTEAGTRRPRPHTFAAILAALELTPEDVRGTVVAAHATGEEARQQLRRFVEDEVPADLAPFLLQLLQLVAAGHRAALDHPDES